MRFIALARLIPALAVILIAGPVAAAAYDIRAELKFINGAWVVQIRNVGSTIPGPIRSEFQLAIPGGAKINSWTLNGWQCTPSPPFSGPVSVACTITLQGAWAAGTILSNQVFYSAAVAGAVTKQACVRARLLLPDAGGNFQPSAEISKSNNSACA
jgi:hypothetical protein